VAEDPPIPYVDQAPALTRVAASDQIVGQTLEALFVYLADDGAHALRPIHAATLQVGWNPDRQPGDVVVAAARRYGLAPLLVHSTSWRAVGSRLVLTYAAVVRPPAEPSAWLVDEPVRRAELARGDALGAPTTIDVPQVLEHAFRHLAWLVRDDDAVRGALPDWHGFLAGYEPEPFRAFGGAPG
jgi:hypothetical protein